MECRDMSLPIYLPPINPAVAIGTGGAVVAAIIIIMNVRTRSRQRGDLYALIIEETDKSIYTGIFIKLADRVYAAINTSYPLFLIVPPGVSSYVCYMGKQKVPCVLAYARGMLAMPLDPQIISATSHLLSTDDMVSLSHEETIKLLRSLLDMQEKKIGKMTVASPLTVAFAFDVKKVVMDLINKVFANANEAVIHYFRSARNLEALERYLQALARYAERRYSWLIYIAIILIAAGVAAVLIMQFWGGR